MRWDDRVAQERIARLDALIGELETLPGAARATALDVVAALVEVYGEALARILARVDDGTAQALAADELVAHLLLVHDLHPVALDERVARALDEVRPYLRSHGGDVDLLGVGDGVVRLRMNGSCHGCPSSSMTLKLAIESAIRKVAPEIERIDADEQAPEPAPPPPGALPMFNGDGRPAPALPDATWVAAGSLAALPAGATELREVAGEQLLFARAREALYAYRPSCPGCGASLGDAALLEADLLCAGCGRRYDLRRAGRCRDGAELALEPVPLLTGDGGAVRVALRTAVMQ